MNMDFGLAVTYNGKSYTLLCEGIVKDYPVGGLICEYCRLSPTNIKPIIMECTGLDEAVTPDSMTSAILQLHEKLFEHFPPVTAIMISLEFQDAASDWMKAIRENRIEEYMNYYADENTGMESVKDYIFADTPYHFFGCGSILQVLLSCYFNFATVYVNIKFMFNTLIDENSDPDQQYSVLKLYSDLCGELIHMQHIDFRFLATAEKGLESLYTIKTSMSLLLFEMANAQQVDQQFVKCSNCGQIFVLEGRSDTIYCNYPSPQNKNKSCREIGAQVARANKERSDIVTKEYRKSYMRHKMMTKRHPADSEKRKKFEALTNGMKEWKIKLADGSATTQDFLSWLQQF